MWGKVKADHIHKMYKGVNVAIETSELLFSNGVNHFRRVLSRQYPQILIVSKSTRNYQSMVFVIDIVGLVYLKIFSNKQEILSFEVTPTNKF